MNVGLLAVEFWPVTGVTGHPNAAWTCGEPPDNSERWTIPGHDTRPVPSDVVVGRRSNHFAGV